MNNDYTAAIEKDISKTKKARLRNAFRLFLFVFKSSPGISTIFMGLSIVLSLLVPLIALLWGDLIDKVNIYEPGGVGITAIILMLLGYYILTTLSELLNRYLIPREQIERLDIVQSNRFEEKLFSKLYRKIGRLSPEYMEVPRINDVIKRTFDFSSGSWNGEGLQRGVMISFYTIIAKFISLIAIGFSLYVYNPWLALIIVIALIPTIYTRYIGERLVNKFKYDSGPIMREAGYYQDLLLKKATKEIKTLGLFDFIHGKWKTVIDEYTVKQRRANLISAILNLMSSLIANIVSISALIFAVILMTRGRITIGGLSAIFILIKTLTADTSSLFEAIGRFINRKNEATQYFELLELKEQNGNGADISGIDSIEFKNVNYRYPLTDRYVLKDASFRMKAGEKIAFVGENGAGKTTFVKLLTGMLSPSEGSICVNEKERNDINSKSLYDSMAAVFQEPSKYLTLTVKENVLLGDTVKPFDEDLYNYAMEQAEISYLNADDVLGKEIGGIEISGGEWQRLAIARCYYRDRNFIILDEPTSNLDPIAESSIFQKYINMSKDKTLIMVTHRISAASLADRIIVFKDGVITEDGHHSILIRREGEYARLYHAQAEWYNR